MHRILLLDDEPYIVSAMRRCLSSMAGIAEGVHFEFFTSATKALERIEIEDFDLVICDYRMPEMNGVEFLSRVIEIQPDIERMLMSGNADREVVLAAINEVQVMRFICKPWDDNELRASVAQALGIRRAATSDEAPGRRQQHGQVRRRIEEECHGIMHVDRAEDGGIILSADCVGDL
jgi:two-component system, probable response regulator PhcQ